MSYRITIVQLGAGIYTAMDDGVLNPDDLSMEPGTIRKHVGITGPQDKKVYEQTVDEIDLHAVMQAVNKKPRRPRGAKAEKKDEK